MVTLMDMVEASHLEVRYFRDSFSSIKWMDKDSFNGQMVLCTKVNGEGARKMVEANSIGLMVKCMKVNSKTTNVMETDHCFTLVEKGSKVSGKWGKKMEDVCTLGRMVLVIL
jgi:hypothetical protein